jgi:hypothetical protein
VMGKKIFFLNISKNNCFVPKSVYTYPYNSDCCIDIGVKC